MDTMGNLLKQLNELTYKPVFPVVLKNSQLKMIEVVYRDHVDIYKFEKSDRSVNVGSEEPEQKFSPYAEVRMAKNNGFKEIHAQESWLTNDSVKGN